MCSSSLRLDRISEIAREDGQISELSKLEQSITELDRRVSILETAKAVEAERMKHIDLRFDRLDEAQKETKNALSRVTWTIITAIILGFVSFMVNGGLKIGG